MTVKRFVKWAFVSNTVAIRAACFYVAVLMLYKGAVANDITDTLAEDPMELWIALGVSMLLLDRASRWMRPK